MPYGKSPFAFSGGADAARCTTTAGVTFSSLTRSVGCSSGAGDAAVAVRFRELGRRAARFVVFFSVGLGVGRGWKAFETDWPTFLKRSPTGSAFTHRPLIKNSTATGSEIQREQLKQLVRFSAFNVKTRFSFGIGVKEKENFLCTRTFAVFIKTDNATAATAVCCQSTQQRFRCNRPQEC